LPKGFKVVAVQGT